MECHVNVLWWPVIIFHSDITAGWLGTSSLCAANSTTSDCFLWTKIDRMCFRQPATSFCHEFQLHTSILLLAFLSYKVEEAKERKTDKHINQNSIFTTINNYKTMFITNEIIKFVIMSTNSVLFSNIFNKNYIPCHELWHLWRNRKPNTFPCNVRQLNLKKMNKYRLVTMKLITTSDAEKEVRELSTKKTSCLFLILFPFFIKITSKFKILRLFRSSCKTLYSCN